MKIIHRYLFRLFLPAFFVAFLFFILLLELGEVFGSLVQFLENNVSISQIMKIMILYIPKCVSFSLPLAILFAGSYTMGNMYAQNELISVFSSGMSLTRFTIPLLIFGFILSLGMVFFEDYVVIKFYKAKNEYKNELLSTKESLNTYDIVILSEGSKIIYISDYYDDTEKKLIGNIVVVRDEDGNIQDVLRVSTLQWNGTNWTSDEVYTYTFNSENKVASKTDFDFSLLTEPPETFQKNVVSVEEMSFYDAKVFIDNLKKTGLPYYEELSKYYRRFSFPFTIFIVLFFSISLGGKFKKNILLMSLLFSLGIATLYYITEMLTMLAAKWEYISPLSGAVTPVIIFTILSAYLLRHART